MDKWYLAGPFFNQSQRVWAKFLRDAVKSVGIPYYAPIENEFQSGIDNRMKAELILATNVDQLYKSKTILCQLDWLLPDSQVVLLRSRENKRTSFTILNIPDSGTVWEMGFANALRHDYTDIRIIGYTVNECKKLNLMLGLSCDIFLNGKEKVLEFVKSRGTLFNDQKYKGELQ